MNEKKLTLKIAIVAITIYISTMGLGMYLMHNVFGYNYGEPGMMHIMFWVEVILSLIVIITVVKFSSWKNIGFGKMIPRHILWIIPGVLLTVALLGLIIMAINKQGLSSSEWSLLLLVGITTLLVGFSEEVMFRGIALRGALTSKGLFTSMLFSAVTFSLLHSVNILGGAPVGGVLVQLVLTFIFGFFMAPIALKLQSLIPLIIFHFLWDFSLFVAPMVSVDTKFMMYFFLPIEIIFSIILWISMRKESVESVKI